VLAYPGYTVKDKQGFIIDAAIPERDLGSGQGIAADGILAMSAALKTEQE